MALKLIFITVLVIFCSDDYLMDADCDSEMYIWLLCIKMVGKIG
jgi:hypothetical protein